MTHSSSQQAVNQQTRAYSNGAVQPILCSSKSRMCSPSCKIVQSKICALNLHTNQQQELFSHLLHPQRWQVGAGDLFILQAGGVYRISQQRCWFGTVDPGSLDTGAAQASDASFHLYWFRGQCTCRTSVASLCEGQCYPCMW